MIPRLNELQPATDETRRFLAALRSSGFSGELADDLATRVVGSTDNSIYQILPQAIVYPRTRDDVVLVAKAASRAEFKGLTLTARGGGTGTNGQSLTTGLIVDLGRHMDHIGGLSLPDGDGRAGTVVVEPGVVLDQLNQHLEPHRVFFAPNLSPSSRATLGGMISTDASGQGSRVYGKTSQHVVDLEVVLVDGSVLVTRPLSRAEVLAMPAWEANAPLADRLPRAVLELAQRARPDFVAKLPRLHRFLTGYNLERVWDPDTDILDLKWLVTGAEGTLGFVTRATLAVVPIPTARRLAVLEFASFEAALASAEVVIASEPSSIETVDEKVLDLAREDVIFAQVGAYFPERPPPIPKTRAVNLVEFESTDPVEVDQKIDALIAACTTNAGLPGWPIAHGVARSESDRKALWQLRAKGVGLLGNTKGRRKPVPFVEDTVVPPERLSAYVAEFRALLDAEGLTYGMFGHVDVGCLHVRPALDLRDPADEARVRKISDRIAQICQKYGGVIWGEHGKGFRSEYSPLHFGEVFPHVEAVKGLFDPDQRLNPGKIATPPGHRHQLATIDQPTRGQKDREITAEAQAHWTLAIDCNGNGQCFHWDPDHVMCPSGKVTRDRIHTPKGRAGVMREWLRQLSKRGRGPTPRRSPSVAMTVVSTPLRAVNSVGRALGRYDYSHQVKRAMDGCLACKACATQCPVKVDVPTFRSEFLELYHTRYLRPVREHLIAGLESALGLMSRTPRFFNFFLKNRAFQAVFGRLVGLVDTPPIAPRSLKRLMHARGLGLLEPAELMRDGDRKKVVLVQDAFTTYYEPEVVLATRDLLERLGCTVHIAPFFPNGKGMHVKGMLRRFAGQAKKNAADLARWAASGATLVTIDPAVALTYRDEYRHALGKDLGFDVRMLQEVLVDLVPKPSVLPPAPGPSETYQLFGHCTEKTLAVQSQRQWAEVFARLGLRLDLVQTGCCGMSGAFGHERVHREESQAIWEMSWARWLPEDPDKRGRVLATGYSCRSQAHRFAALSPRHPVLVLLDRLS
ncbi:MAG: FAD-binding oxidoreductase [Deltaproteobacteria bacterium]|nr:FAD-binding oxidoreductase [Deltaproteobacteria bacterium]